MTTRQQRDYKTLRSLGYRAQEALETARTMAEWREQEDDTVRIIAEPEWELYSSVSGVPETEAEQRRIDNLLEKYGCWVVISQYRDANDAWQWADSIGMCTGYNNPCSPLENEYVPELMRAALEQRALVESQQFID